MVEVRLHGALAKEFGMVWNLAISRPAEAVSAIEANKPGFKSRIRALANKGMFFRVRTQRQDYNDDTIGMNLGSAKRLDIIPVMTGSSAGIRFVTGALLVLAAPFLGFASPYAFNAGVALMLGSIVEWLTPVPKQGDRAASLKSWTFSGPSNELGQNQVIPVIYGEVLTGGYPISGGLSAAQLSASGSTDPSVAIGGKFDASIRSMATATTSTMVFQFGCSPLNLAEPYTYAWTVTGLAGADAIRVINGDKATVRIEVDATTTAILDLTGEVHVTLTGFNSAGGSPVSASASATETITAHFDHSPADPIFQHGA